MKKGIHPELKKAQVKCACGHVFETLSTKESIRWRYVPSATPSLRTGKASGFNRAHREVREKVRRKRSTEGK